MPPVSTNVATKTITKTKIAIATGFLAISTAFAGLAATTSTPATGLKPDLFIASISMQPTAAYPTQDELNKVTIAYRNIGKAPIDKPFIFQIQFSPIIPDATISHVTAIVDGLPVLATVPKIKNGLFQISVSQIDTASSTLGVYGLNQYQLDPNETGEIQFFFQPFKTYNKTFKQFNLIGSIDVKKVITESNEKNNVKKVTIPKANVKIIVTETEKPTCVDLETPMASSSGKYLYPAGADLTSAGTTTLKYGSGSTKKEVIKKDKCAANKTLIEYSCAAAGNKIEETTKDCTIELKPLAGQEAVCVMGACKIQVLQKTSCTDTDPTNDVLLKGQVNATYNDGSTGIKEDTCTSETYLQQESCTGSSGTSCTFKYGSASKCVDGACLIPIVTDCQDTDPADDLLINGTTTITYEGGQTETLVDTCYISKVKQYNCSDKLNPVTAKLICAAIYGPGFSCKAGVCSK